MTTLLALYWWLSDLRVAVRSGIVVGFREGERFGRIRWRIQRNLRRWE